MIKHSNINQTWPKAIDTQVLGHRHPFWEVFLRLQPPPKRGELAAVPYGSIVSSCLPVGLCFRALRSQHSRPRAVRWFQALPRAPLPDPRPLSPDAGFTSVGGSFQFFLSSLLLNLKKLAFTKEAYAGSTKD
jgi:hypothetical protein